MLTKLAEELGMVCLSQKDSDLSKEDIQNGKLTSHYLVMAHNENDMGKLAQDPSWSRIDPPPGTIVWTDNYSHILNLLHW